MNPLLLLVGGGAGLASRCRQPIKVADGFELAREFLQFLTRADLLAALEPDLEPLKLDEVACR